MSKTMGKRSEKSGLPPGTPMHFGEKKTEKVRISIIDYDRGSYEAGKVLVHNDVYEQI